MAPHVPLPSTALSLQAHQSRVWSWPTVQAGTKDLGLAAYAEGFVGAGLAVLLFDYRHFGASAGQPRQLIDIARQLDDYRAAVRFARTCEGVDPTRIALWGTS